MVLNGMCWQHEQDKSTIILKTGDKWWKGQKGWQAYVVQKEIENNEKSFDS